MQQSTAADHSSALLALFSEPVSVSVTNADSRFFDDRTPLGDVGLDLHGQVGRRGSDHGDAHFLELSLGHRIAYRGNAIDTELAHDRRRRFRRYEQGDP